MKFDFLKDNKFLSARHLKNHYFFEKVELSTVSWDEVINEFDRSVSANERVKYRPQGGFVTHNAANIPVVQEFLNEYHGLDKLGKPSAHCYISLSKESSTFGRHQDIFTDVLFWQIIGKTQWLVEDGETTFEYTLDKNNLIYIPRGMYHTVIPLTARAGISFGLDY